MIAYKKRESRRARSKMSKNLEVLYKEGKCRDCSVVVTRMDFAKILGKFTKVKIQYETNTSPKSQKSTGTSPNRNTRLKSNENGMVLIHRNAYNPHPAKELKNSKKNKSNDIHSKKPLGSSSPKNNILKENNNCKKTPSSKKTSKTIHADHKQYTIVFLNPKVNGCSNDFKTKITLPDLIPQINTHILPSEEWCIEYFPKAIEPKDDKMYNRIAAELEDLMYNKITPNETINEKADEFPSIMDILNDNTTEASTETKDHINTTEFKPSLESSDVEAMLLGKPEVENESKPLPMDIDSSDVNKLIEDVADVVQLAPSVESNDKLDTDIVEPLHSPSILDETLQKGIEEHLPVPLAQREITNNNNNTLISESEKNDVIEKDPKPEKECEKDTSNEDMVKPTLTIKPEEVTEVTFKQMIDGKCPKTVTCLKNLRYNIQLNEKSVEFLGAPKYISSIEDIQVLLQIVNESTLESLYVLH